MVSSAVCSVCTAAIVRWRSTVEKLSKNEESNSGEKTTEDEGTCAFSNCLFHRQVSHTTSTKPKPWCRDVSNSCHSVCSQVIDSSGSSVIHTS
ncbi:hypothetical protein WN55_01698 [Dufourea novaeangliae]|uniref:Uncharacterized protein n=1 Tax=Dufourea novaeangliae TaxID=178035 RepID=A0A154PI52_DUFNO|nr:hypothetical protein WN55_01698 [Dufourea novaeangliae]